MGNALRGIVGRPWPVLGCLGVLVFAAWAVNTRHQSHHVKLAFTSAVSIAPGLDVQANGVDVGKVDKVQLVDGQPIVTIGISDDRVWPLHAGTTAEIRYGTTIGNGTRRIDLVPGPSKGRELPEDGLISEKTTANPTEFDQMFNTLNENSRADLQGMSANLDTALSGKETAIGHDLEVAPPAIKALGGFVAGLADDTTALSNLVRSADRVTGTLAARQAKIRSLMTVASKTFATFSANTTGVRESIERFPAFLRQTRTTLRRLDPSVDKLDALMDDLAPGAGKLSTFAAVARPTLASLRKTLPDVVDVAKTARKAGPDITGVLADGVPFMKKLDPTLTSLTPIVGCLRPYAPELAGFLSNWASFTQAYDGTSHYARVRAVVSQTAFNDNPLNSKQLVDLTGAIYAGLRPPGLNSGHPVFMPECGVGQDVLDPSKDWESGK